MPDSQRVCRANTGLAIAVRDELYGCHALPLGRKLRAAWAGLVGYWRGFGLLSRPDVIAVAQDFAAELRAAGRVPVSRGDTPEDEMLRREMSRRLLALYRERARQRPRSVARNRLSLALRRLAER